MIDFSGTCVLPHQIWIDAPPEMEKFRDNEHLKRIQGSLLGLAMGDAAGMVKMLADEDTDEILGVHIIGPGASELIAECVVTMEFHGASEDLARIVHAHPTLSEAVHEAALHVDRRAIHRGN